MNSTNYILIFILDISNFCGLSDLDLLEYFGLYLKLFIVLRYFLLILYRNHLIFFIIKHKYNN